MQSTQTASLSKTMLWTGRIISALPVGFVLMSAVVKFIKTVGVVEGFSHAGLSESFVLPIGVVELVCIVVYLIPRTAILGAILVTGLGGATITILPIGDPLFPMPVVLGMMA